LWFGFPPGLVRLDVSGVPHQIPLLQSSKSGQPDPVLVHHLYAAPDGIFWLSGDLGLFRFDPKTGQSVQYTMRDGLPSDSVVCSVQDDEGNLWLGTQAGLSRFNLKEQRFYNYDESDGLQGKAFRHRSCLKARDGRLYFGGDNGFNAFYPRQVLKPEPEPPVVFTRVEINGKQASLPVWALPELKLTPDQNGFSIEFASLGYVHPQRTRYRYRLEGAEQNWVEVDSRHRFARYTGVGPGSYTFQVQAAVDGHSWARNGASIRLTVETPWWRTFWTKSAGILLLAALLIGGHKRRIQTLQQREGRLRALVDQHTTELVKARDEAQAASRAKSAFLANMSHELRTPLNAILGFADLLRSDNLSDRQRRDLDSIHRGGEHLLGLINDVLDVAKIEAGRGMLQYEPCDLNALLHSVTDMMRVPASAKNLLLVLKQEAGRPHLIRTDAPKLRQVLINLLANGIKFTEHGSVTLRVHSTPAGDPPSVRVYFDVEDTGIGIPEKDQERIFEAFVQSGEKGEHQGTGLGLTISRQFVELMGGTLWVLSAPGKGSVFHVELPFDEVPEDEWRPPEAKPACIVRLEPNQPEHRVLVVDDDPDSRHVLERLLQDAGFPVQAVCGGSEAVEAFLSWQPHFIWMDLGMPGVDGLEATRQIRSQPGGGAVKIAAVSAAAFVNREPDLVTAGLDGFVHKPYGAEEIFSQMERLLPVRYMETDGVLPRGVHPALRAQDISALPVELRNELRSVLILLDRKQLRDTIEKVTVVDGNLGAALAWHTDHYTLTAVLNAINGSESLSRSGAP
jgi:signal transduction histidine kinase/CheY-like chemotaxis protein